MQNHTLVIDVQSDCFLLLHITPVKILQKLNQKLKLVYLTF